MSDGEDTEEMSYDEDEEDYKYEEAEDEEEMSTVDNDIAEGDDMVLDLGSRKLRKLERQVSYQVHPVKNILANQRAMVAEISDMLGIPSHDAALLLRNYKWDKETACDAWWSEQTNLRIKIGLPATVAEDLLCVSLTESCILCHRQPTVRSSKVAQPVEVSKSPQPLSAATTSSSINGMIKGTRAINRDLKALTKQNICEFELPEEDNLFVIDFIIKCQGLWDGITHKFRAKIPSNYPFSYPAITCLNGEKSFHPNIQPTDGSICLGILTPEGWKAMYTLTDLCAGLSGMFVSPNWEHSLNQDVFTLFHDNKTEFFRRLRTLGALNIGKEEHSTEQSTRSSRSSVSSSELVTEDKKGALTRKRSGKNVKAVAVKKGSISSVSSVSSIGVDGINISREDEDVDIKSFVKAAGRSEGKTGGKVGKESSSKSSSEEHSELTTITETVTMVCGHHFCSSCWKCAIEESVDSGPSCLHHLCPAVGCTLVIPEAFVEKFCPDKLARYQHFQLETFVAQNKAANYCPAVGCNRIVEYQKRDKTRIITCDCGSKWCWGCKRDPHAPISCRLIEQWEADRERLMSATMAEVWLAVNVKSCPACKKRIWKDGGCMHVTCGVASGGCGSEFCWLCLEKWSTHGDGSGGFYACNNYQKAALEGTLKGEAKLAHEAEALAAESRKEVDRYQWHFERHKFMEQSRRLAEERGVIECTEQCAERIAAIASADIANQEARSQGRTPTGAPGTSTGPLARCQHGLLAKHQQAIEAALKPILGNPPSAHQTVTVNALVEANAALVTCRDALRWIYVAKYFFSENGPKEIFQSNHDALESHTEKLNRMIEKDWHAIAQSVLQGRYKAARPSSHPIYDPLKLAPSTTGGLSDCGSRINLSPSELYDQLRLLRDMTLETLRFMAAMCQANEFEEYFGF